QTDHIHLIVEAKVTLALTRGTQGLAIRCARAFNRACHRRGRVWRHRYHAHYLRTPREVRAAYVYVLLNHRKHLRAGPGIDPCSSGAWFDGWARPPPLPGEPSPVAPPTTWLGAIGCAESPAPYPVSPSSSASAAVTAAASRSSRVTRVRARR